jgi:hypothetical protein
VVFTVKRESWLEILKAAARREPTLRGEAYRQLTDISIAVCRPINRILFKIHMETSRTELYNAVEEYFTEGTTVLHYYTLLLQSHYIIHGGSSVAPLPIGIICAALMRILQ